MPIQILMPALSPTMTEGTLAKWLKGEGDSVKSGDILAEIETDKATMEVEAVDEGVLGKIMIAEGSEGVPVNTVIAVLLEEGEDASALDGMDAAPAPAAAPPAPEPAPQAAAAPQAPTPAPSAAPAAAPAASTGERIFASPLARRMAEQAGLDLTGVGGSGPNGRIVKRDIEAALSGAAPTAGPTAAPAAAPIPATRPAPQPVGDYTEVPNNTMRKVIAQRLSEAKRDIPHFYLSIDCEIDALLAMRQDLNARSPEGEGAYKLSVNDFVVRAVALALRQVPTANATWTENAVLLYTAVDVAVAVATPGGLITPVLRDADNKGLAAISNEVRDLATRARDGKLAPEEYQGGGFTISNLGMYGVKDFSAIINPPQSCILAVGAGEQRPVVHDGALAIATVMTCTLSVDHRSVDGAIGAEFMAAFKRLIEEPLTMLL
jgi:pyruvate dehydrogenase E2 component (dihydrolipoamide acetyltransferase)